MPSGNTASPPPTPTDSTSPAQPQDDHPSQPRAITRRRLSLLVVSGCILAGLSACAEGTARDAERGKEADAKRTSVVDEVQATESARRVSGTPPASPSAGP